AYDDAGVHRCGQQLRAGNRGGDRDVRCDLRAGAGRGGRPADRGPGPGRAGLRQPLGPTSLVPGPSSPVAYPRAAGGRFMTTIAPDTTTTGADGCTPQTSPADHAMGPDAAAHVAGTLKALGDPLRLRMLSLIATSPTGEACVCDLATVADVSQPTVSHHLKLLKDVGLLASERRGTWVYYRVQPTLRGAVTTLLDSFAPVAADAANAVPLAGLTDAEDALVRIADRLATAFPDREPGTALGVVRESYTGLARSSAVRAHLLVNTERFARQRLTDITRAMEA